MSSSKMRILRSVEPLGSPDGRALPKRFVAIAALWRLGCNRPLAVAAIRREMVAIAIRTPVKHVVFRARRTSSAARIVAYLRDAVGTPARARPLDFGNQDVLSVG